ncbi:DUF721 domain-containing protein [Cyanobium sp. ATX 6F1]|uniref:DUF721 domain-containing protein n=1 Tax=Cyanobium sp. ATX 6F1 TaxID=2823702 RepID=UPI0020CB9FE8|nr:DUF721 domain-containing protein [Cyanobium sp. ATX 6F1]MCP9915072.1 DUF721 domain-containing protein [Cyanobium sp. ATX 6F1]
MARARPEQTRRIGNLSLLMAAPRPPAAALGDCLARLQQEWQREGSLAALWQAWPRIAGPQLAPHCRPTSFRGGLLTVGASHPQWLQGLRYNRHQLLGALRGAGFTVRDLRFQQIQPAAPFTPGAEAEAATWAVHPSRVDVHGMGTCPDCGRPSPGGEIQRWGHCSFCRRQPQEPLGESQ